MRDIIDVITSRKSIRRYKPDPIPDEMIDKILEAGRWAPTGENYQPWRLIVIRDQETRNRIGDLARLGSGAQSCQIAYPVKTGQWCPDDGLVLSRADAKAV